MIAFSRNWKTNARATIATAAIGIELLLCPGLAAADYKVWTPDVNLHELELENVGDVSSDPVSAKNGAQSYTFEAEYGLTTWWQAELELEFDRAPGSGQPTVFDQITWENLFQFTERGEYWLDAGFFAEYGQARLKGNPNETTFGPVLRKDLGGTSNSINLFLEKDLGPNAANRPVFLYAWETRVDAWVMRAGQYFEVEPGLQLYGQPGPVGQFPKWNRQDERAGPQLFGKIHNLGPGTLEWNGGVLFGLTSATPRTTVRWQAEYEIHF
ncbi:MAG TPA: hypothetical protein VEK74_11955 [Burkholderiaceae bacterium]|nr:hypothetical protein [Burkholderiaceae bacterium]